VYIKRIEGLPGDRIKLKTDRNTPFLTVVSMSLVMTEKAAMTVENSGLFL
jgi:signal peptidase I